MIRKKACILSNLPESERFDLVSRFSRDGSYLGKVEALVHDGSFVTLGLEVRGQPYASQIAATLGPRDCSRGTQRIHAVRNFYLVSEYDPAGQRTGIVIEGLSEGVVSGMESVLFVDESLHGYGEYNIPVLVAKTVLGHVAKGHCKLDSFRYIVIKTDPDDPHNSIGIWDATDIYSAEFHSGRPLDLADFGRDVKVFVGKNRDNTAGFIGQDKYVIVSQRDQAIPAFGMSISLDPRNRRRYHQLPGSDDLASVSGDLRDKKVVVVGGDGDIQSQLRAMQASRAVKNVLFLPNLDL